LNYEGKKMYAEAIAAYQRAISLSKTAEFPVHTALAEKDQAFEWLDRAYQERDESFIHLKVDPRLDSLRSDPRLTERLRLINLAQ
jgi:hypothetical protein